MLKLTKVDFHVHTDHSPDSVITFPMLLKWCRSAGIDAVAIMDHDVIEGAFEFAAMSRELHSRGDWAPRILVGEEVRTSGGEICGLFLEAHVPKGLTPLETMQAIRSQGGLVYVPHPFDMLKFKRLKARQLEELSGMIDIIEAFNGKPRFPAANVLARRFLERHEFPAGAGSDSHEPTHIGAAHVEMEAFEGPGDLLEKIRRGKIVGKRYSPLTSACRRVTIRRWTERGGPQSA